MIKRKRPADKVKTINKPEAAPPPTKEEIEKEIERQKELAAALEIRLKKEKQDRADQERDKAEKKKKMNSILEDHKKMLAARDRVRETILNDSKKKATKAA